MTRRSAAPYFLLLCALASILTLALRCAAHARDPDIAPDHV